MCGGNVHYATSQKFGSSLVNSESTLLCAEELKIETSKEKYFCWLNIDGTTVGSLQMETFEHFLRFHGNLSLCLGSPLKKKFF